MKSAAFDVALFYWHKKAALSGCLKLII